MRRWLAIELGTAERDGDKLSVTGPQRVVGIVLRHLNVTVTHPLLQGPSPSATDPDAKAVEGQDRTHLTRGPCSNDCPIPAFDVDQDLGLRE
jgi:hypothetical protein